MSTQQHTGTRDAFLAAYHRERAQRRRRRRARLRALVGRKPRPTSENDQLAALAELMLPGEDRG